MKSVKSNTAIAGYSLKDRWNEVQLHFLNEFCEVMANTIKQKPISAEDFHTSIKMAFEHNIVSGVPMAETLGISPGAVSRWRTEDSAPATYNRPSILEYILGQAQEQIQTLKNGSSPAP